MRKAKRLSGRYDADNLPEVSENLDAAQLQTSVFQPTWFLALAFRFGSDPPTHKKAAPAEAAKPKDKPAAGSPPPSPSPSPSPSDHE